MEDHDFLFVNKPLSAKEENDFSEFLKSRKSKTKSRQNMRPSASPKIELA